MGSGPASAGPAPTAEGFLESFPPDGSGSDFAALLNISPRAVRDLAERGLLVKAAAGRYETLGSLRTYIDHLRRQAAGRATETGLNLADERAKTEKLKQEDFTLSIAIKRNKMLAREAVREGWTRFASIVRSSYLSLPSKIRAAVPHLTAHDAVVIDRIVRERLEDAAAELEGGKVPGAVAPSDLTGGGNGS